MENFKCTQNFKKMVSKTHVVITQLRQVSTPGQSYTISMSKSLSSILLDDFEANLKQFYHFKCKYFSIVSKR